MRWCRLPLRLCWRCRGRQHTLTTQQGPSLCHNQIRRNLTSNCCDHDLLLLGVPLGPTCREILFFNQTVICQHDRFLLYKHDLKVIIVIEMLQWSDNFMGNDDPFNVSVRNVLHKRYRIISLWAVGRSQLSNIAQPPLDLNLRGNMFPKYRYSEISFSEGRLTNQHDYTTNIENFVGERNYDQ